MRFGKRGLAELREARRSRGEEDVEALALARRGADVVVGAQGPGVEGVAVAGGLGRGGDRVVAVVAAVRVVVVVVVVRGGGGGGGGVVADVVVVDHGADEEGVVAVDEGHLLHADEGRDDEVEAPGVHVEPRVRALAAHKNVLQGARAARPLEPVLEEVGLEAREPRRGEGRPVRRPEQRLRLRTTGCGRKETDARAHRGGFRLGGGGFARVGRGGADRGRRSQGELPLVEVGGGVALAPVLGDEVADAHRLADGLLVAVARVVPQDRRAFAA